MTNTHRDPAGPRYDDLPTCWPIPRAEAEVDDAPIDGPNDVPEPGRGTPNGTYERSP